MTGTITSDTGILARQHLLPLRVPNAAHIIGCGGAGTWVAIFAAMSGVKRIVLFDGDVLEPSNLNRLPYPAGWIGIRKTEALRRFIGVVRPNCVVVTNDYLSLGNIGLLHNGVVMDCTDDIDIQREVRKYCKKKSGHLEYIGCHVDGEDIQVNRTVPMFGPKDDGSGYRVTPSWVVPTVIAGAFGLLGMLVDKFEILCKLRQVGIEKDVYERGMRDGIESEEERFEKQMEDACGNCDNKVTDDHGYCPSCERIYIGDKHSWAHNMSDNLVREVRRVLDLEASANSALDISSDLHNKFEYILLKKVE